jgi:hypothetical protein
MLPHDVAVVTTTLRLQFLLCVRSPLRERGG